MARLAVTAVVALVAGPAAARHARAQVAPDGDVLIDRAPEATCRAAHAIGPTADCPRAARLGADRLALFPPVRFGPDRATLPPSARAALDDAAAILTAHPEVALTIVGRGKDEPDRARRLSYERARTVRDYLVVRGVPAAQLTAVGGGDPDPRDRSVELRVRRPADAPGTLAP